jgi:hypothetical protein
MIVIYTAVCAPCRYRAQMRHAKWYARSIGVEAKVVEAIGNPEVVKEARKLSTLPMPFVYNDATGDSIALAEFKTDTKI